MLSVKLIVLWVVKVTRSTLLSLLLGGLSGDFAATGARSGHFVAYRRVTPRILVVNSVCLAWATLAQLRHKQISITVVGIH